MFEKPETKMILFKMVLIVVIGLLLGAVFTTVENFVKEDLPNNYTMYSTPEQIENIPDEMQGKIKTLSVIDFLKTPLIVLIAIIIWFSIIIAMLRLYWGQDELVNGIKAPSVIIIIGAFLEQLSLGKLSVFSTALAHIDPILITVGSIILLFGFVIMFYNILRYVWVKI